MKRMFVKATKEKSLGGTEYWALKGTCPYCGDTHIHGGGPTDQPVDDIGGHRVAHCSMRVDEANEGYILVLAA